MERAVGTVVRGVRAPIIREGDDLAAIVTKSVLDCAAAEGAAFRDRDVVSVTEAIVARAQGNYATPDDIAADVRAKFGDHTVGVVFPILSRNRFAVCLKGIARGVKKMVLLLSYPSDEVGNHLIDPDLLDEAGITDQYLIINGFDMQPESAKARAGVVEMIDRTRTRLLGIVPMDVRLTLLSEKGKSVFEGEDSNARRAFENIASRLCGTHVPLLDGFRGVKRQKLLFG